MASNSTIVSPIQLAIIMATGDFDEVNGIIYDKDRVPFPVSELVVNELSDVKTKIRANIDNTQEGGKA